MTCEREGLYVPGVSGVSLTITPFRGGDTMGGGISWVRVGTSVKLDTDTQSVFSSIVLGYFYTHIKLSQEVL